MVWIRGVQGSKLEFTPQWQDRNQGNTDTRDSDLLLWGLEITEQTYIFLWNSYTYSKNITLKTLLTSGEALGEGRQARHLWPFSPPSLPEPTVWRRQKWSLTVASPSTVLASMPLDRTTYKASLPFPLVLHRMQMWWFLQLFCRHEDIGHTPAIKEKSLNRLASRNICL